MILSSKYRRLKSAGASDFRHPTIDVEVDSNLQDTALSEAP